MEHRVAKDLIKNGVTINTGAQVWADLGCGEGTFTIALASLLPAGSMIIAVDKNPAVLDSIPEKAGNTSIQKLNFDFNKSQLSFKDADGIMMANSLHYYKDKATILIKAGQSLKGGGQLIIIEYETQYPNPWVPYPITKDDLINLLEECGFTEISSLGKIKSRYGHIIYSLGCNNQ